MVIGFNQFNCYKNIKENDKSSDFYHPEYEYNLEMFPSKNLQKELYPFVLHRGNKLTFKSLYQDRRAYILAAEFLSTHYPNLESVLDLPLEDAENEMEKWLIKQGIAATLKTKNGTTQHAAIRYLRQAMNYLTPKDNCVFFRDLECYQHLTEADKHSTHYTPDLYFDIDLLPSAFQEEFKRLILKRGSQLRFTSMISERQNYNHLCLFIKEKYSSTDNIRDITKEQFMRAYKVWSLKNGFTPTVTRKRRNSAKTFAEPHPFFKYAEMVINSITNTDDTFHFEDDIWKIANLDFVPRIPSTCSVKTINFSGITQSEMRDEVKRTALFRMKEVTIRTVTAEIHATTMFTEFLSHATPNLTSLNEVDREVIEEYIIYLNTEDSRRKNYRSELMHLKSVLETLGLITDDDALTKLFLPSDFPKNSIPLYRFYTDSELQRLNEGFRKLDAQTGRLMIIHELLGCRISETLSLTSDCIISAPNGKSFIKINQAKVNRSYLKPINSDVVSLVEKSIAYTKEHYGDRDYVFVSDKDPSKPFQYGALYYRLQCMIIENDLRDDHGELFTVGTHLFRKTYGKRLCDMGLDDTIIAKLLGHSGTSSVKHYRRMSSIVLAEGTKDLRAAKGEMIRKYNKGWKTNEKEQL